MKRLEELGVSPAPWRVEKEPMSAIVYEGKTTHECASVSASICASIGARREADMKLIAASPDLYECLREAVERLSFACCERKCLDGGECVKKEIERQCCVAKWRKALEKAGGEA